MKFNNAQISLEYLIIFSISLGALLSFLPILSRARDLSVKSVRRNRIDSLSRDISIGCEEVLITGEPVVIDIDREINLFEEKEELIISDNGFNISSDWSEYCAFDKKKDYLIIERKNE